MNGISPILCIILCVVCFLAGALIVFLFMQKKSSGRDEEEYIEVSKQLAAKTEKLNTIQQQFTDTQAENSSLKNQLNKTIYDLQDATNRLAAVQEQNKQLTEWIHSAEKSLSDKFEALSKKIVESNNDVFIKSANDKLADFAKNLDNNLQGNNEKVGNIITPVSKQLEELQKKVEELEKSRVEAYTGLSASVKDLQERNTQLYDATQLLNRTLNNTAQRGRWGEEQLRRIAELAGMVEHIDFDEQQSIAANGSRQRPDMQIYLTGNRVIPVDSKAPMDAYLKYIEATESDQQKQFLQEHCRAVRSHIDTLNKKAYWADFERSSEFVVMVIPYESGLSAAFENDRDIFTYAMERNVLLLSPITFYAFLKSVSLGWTENKMAENAKEIAKAGKELIDRVDKFCEHIDNIGKSLKGAVSGYNDAVGSYNRMLVPSMNRFRELNEKEAKPSRDTILPPKETTPKRLSPGETFDG